MRAMQRQGRDNPDPGVGRTTGAGAGMAHEGLARRRRLHEFEPPLYPVKRSAAQHSGAYFKELVPVR